jgi:hypothetical protein
LIRRINLLAAGIIIMPWYNGALKDEARPLEKLLDYKIRIFYTVDIYTNTIAKMFLMPLVMLLMKYPYISKCFGALNSGSKEWDDLFNYLRGKLTDMDFSCFDTSHWTILFKACAKFFYKLAQAFYRDEHYSKIVYYVVYSLCVALFSYNGTFSIKLKGLPSGHMLTLIINSIVNVLLMMVAFFLLCPDRFEDFFDLVTPATLGDDNLSGVDESVADRFNVQTVAPLYHSWGYHVTNANKSDELASFVSREEAVFAKRRFRFEPAIGCYVAPLEKDSIWKMLSFYKTPDDKSDTAHFAVLFDVGQREMFLHGREELVKYQEMCEKICEKHSINVKWVGFDEYVTRFINNDPIFMNWI